MERDGEAFFRDLAGRCVNPKVRRVLELLAEAEQEHCRLFERLSKASTRDSWTNYEGRAVHAATKNLFAGLKAAGESFDLKGSEIDLFRKAQELERKSEAFYLDRAEKAGDPQQKKIYLLIAAEEREHFRVLDDLIDITLQPGKFSDKKD
jgi:rubrerythrin